jgi:hypothetical protein
MVKNLQHDILRDLSFAVLFLLFYGSIIFSVLTTINLFGLGGIEQQEYLSKTLYYRVILGVGIIILFLLKLIRIKFGDRFFSLLHDPEDSPIWKVPILKNTIANPYLLLLGSIILFSGFTYLGKISQTALLGQADVPNYNFEQQTQPLADVYFAVYPASPAETIELVVFLIFLVNLLDHVIKLDNKVLRSIIMYLGLPIISAIYGIVVHLARYGGSDVALYSVAVFWFFTGLFTILIRSIIPVLVYHDINNLFVKLFQMFSSDFVILIMLFIMIVLSVLWIYWFIKSFQEKPEQLNTI